MRLTCTKIFMRTLIWFFLGISFSYSAYLKFVPIELKQPNGTLLNVFASGDEFYNWVHDKDNYTILQDAKTGFYVYAQVEKGKLVPTQYVVGKVNPANINLVKGANVFPDISKKLAKQNLVSAALPQIGVRYNLVVFIRFKGDKEFNESEYATGKLDNSDRYVSLTNKIDGPSVKHFYSTSSYGQLNIESVIFPTPQNSKIISYEDNLTRDYYLKYNALSNKNGYTDDNKYSRENTLLKNALKFAEAYIPNNAIIDGDSDGVVDNVNFIVIGTGEAWNELLWPHMNSDLGGTLKGKNVKQYNVNMQKSIGDTYGYQIICHELGHSLGLRDLYRYTDYTIDPVGSWSMMSYNRADFLMREKHKLGWISEPQIISADGTYSVKINTQKNNSVYRINSPRKTSEYFLLEFRKRNAFYENNAHGLIISKINTSMDGNAQGPPDEIYVFRPDGNSKTNGSIDSACFSFESGRTAFNDEKTNPIAFLSDDKAAGIDVKNIGSVAGNEISFDVKIIKEVIIPGDYKISKENYEWVDIAQNGTKITNWANTNGIAQQKMDEGYSNEAIPLGFDFLFYGIKYNTIYVGVNGLVSFTHKYLNNTTNNNGTQTGTTFDNSINWPGNSKFPNSIAIAYEDWDLYKGDTFGGGSVKYQTIGNKFILSYENVGNFPQKGDTTNCFQVVLNRNDNSVQLNYKKFGLSSTGAKLTIGMQKDALIGHEYLFNGVPANNIPANGTTVIFRLNATVGIEEATIPATFVVNENYPNPFNPTTTISYSLPEKCLVNIRIFDILGREVRTLLNNVQDAGRNQIKFDAAGLSSGMYIYRIEAVSVGSSTKFSESKKMMLMK